MSKMIRFAIFVFLSLGSISFASARDLFVDNMQGNDRNDGLKAETASGDKGPKKTISAALQVALSGDRIVLKKNDEPYRECVTLYGERRSGSNLAPFTIQGNGATLDGTAPIAKDAWTHTEAGVFGFQPTMAGPHKLFLNDKPAERVAVEPEAKKLPELKPLQWCAWRGAIFFRPEEGKLPGDYNLTQASLQTGVTLYHVDRASIEDLTVQGFRVDGVAAANSATNVYLAGLTLRGNGRSGLSAGPSSTLRVDGCLIGDNAQSQVLSMVNSATSIRNSNLPDGSAPVWINRGGRLEVDGKQAEGGLK